MQFPLVNWNKNVIERSESWVCSTEQNDITWSWRHVPWNKWNDPLTISTHDYLFETASFTMQISYLFNCNDYALQTSKLKKMQPFCRTPLNNFQVSTHLPNKLSRWKWKLLSKTLRDIKHNFTWVFKTRIFPARIYSTLYLCSKILFVLEIYSFTM